MRKRSNSLTCRFWRVLSWQTLQPWSLCANWKGTTRPRFLEVMSHPVLSDGITDEEGQGRRSPVGDQHLQTGVHRRPVDGNRDLCRRENHPATALRRGFCWPVFRHRDQVTPSIDYLEHSVTFMEEIMANPLPVNYVALFFTDAIPEDVGGKIFRHSHRGTA